MWGLTSTGRLSVNVIDTNNNTISATTPYSVPTNVWTHVAQTLSSTNGVRLYFNGVLAATANAVTGRPVGPFSIIGTSLPGTSYCPAGTIATGQFYGSVDEYRVFRDELTPADICRLANPD
jgi:hypothetical protein